MVKSYLRNKTSLPLLVVLLGLTLCKTAQASWSAGLPDVVFRPPAGAWASGMGGAAIADPEYMISWYNPARLPLLRERRASFGAGMRSLGRTEGWASYDFRVPPRVGMGVSFVYRGDPFINNLYDGYYDDKGNVGFERKLGGASMTAASLSIGAGYYVSRKISAGGSVSVNYQSLPTAPIQGSIENSSVTSIGGLDIMASYRMTPNLTLAGGVKNLMRHNSWFINVYDSDFNSVIDETVPPIFVLASSHKTSLFERELVWNVDAQSYFFDGEGKYLGHPEMVIAAGARWKFSDELFLRAGIGELDISGGMRRDSREYWETFSPRIALGFSYDMKRFKQGAFFNYALTTDRVWAGIDQQFDITISF
ncbi:MAG: hypothetical protein FWE57_11995 [Chitinispirillia bacterium]|nr:hypothetical protein [Chitinispirillia bacterium]